MQVEKEDGRIEYMPVGPTVCVQNIMQLLTHIHSTHLPKMLPDFWIILIPSGWQYLGIRFVLGHTPWDSC